MCSGGRAWTQPATCRNAGVSAELALGTLSFGWVTFSQSRHMSPTGGAMRLGGGWPWRMFILPASILGGRDHIPAPRSQGPRGFGLPLAPVCAGDVALACRAAQLGHDLTAGLDQKETQQKSRPGSAVSPWWELLKAQGAGAVPRGLGHHPRLRAAGMTRGHPACAAGRWVGCPEGV